MLLKASQNLLKASASSPSPSFPLSNTDFRLFATCAQVKPVTLGLREVVGISRCQCRKDAPVVEVVPSCPAPQLTVRGAHYYPTFRQIPHRYSCCIVECSSAVWLGTGTPPTMRKDHVGRS